jgi:hypothetical protein
VSVDVRTEVVIARPREQVAAYAGDIDNTTTWYTNIKAVEWETERPATVGSRIAFVAERRLVMSTAEGPFPMKTTYEWADAPGGGTHMTLRNRGRPAGFRRLAAPLMARAIRRANQNDLERLKAALES